MLVQNSSSTSFLEYAFSWRFGMAWDLSRFCFIRHLITWQQKAGNVDLLALDVEEQLITLHFVCAVAVQYKSGREYDLRVAGLELTILISGSAVVALYNSGRE